MQMVEGFYGVFTGIQAVMIVKDTGETVLGI